MLNLTTNPYWSQDPKKNKGQIDKNIKGWTYQDYNNNQSLPPDNSYKEVLPSQMDTRPPEQKFVKFPYAQPNQKIKNSGGGSGSSAQAGQSTPEETDNSKGNTEITGEDIGIGLLSGIGAAGAGLWNEWNKNQYDKRRLKEVDQALNRNNAEYATLNVDRSINLPSELAGKQAFINRAQAGAQQAALTQAQGTINQRGLGGGDVSAPSSAALQSAIASTGANAPYAEQLARTLTEDRLSRNQLNEQISNNNAQRGQMAYQYTDWQQRPDYLSGVENGLATANHIKNLLADNGGELNSQSNGEQKKKIQGLNDQIRYYKAIGLEVPAYLEDAARRGTIDSETLDSQFNY